MPQLNGKKEKKSRVVFLQCWKMPDENNDCGYSMHSSEFEVELFKAGRVIKRSTLKNKFPPGAAPNGALRRIMASNPLYQRVMCANNGLWFTELPDEISDQITQ